jgi:two-component system osmolarity sensor histidine kinase EnvZ
MSGSMSSQIYLIYQMHKSDKEVKLTEDFSRKTGIIPTIVKNKKIHSRYRNYKSKKFLGFINLFPIIDSFTYLRSGLQASNIDLFIIYSSKNKNRVITEIQMENDILKLDLPKKRIVTTRRGVVIAWIVIMSSITALISLLFIKNQIKSIKYLKKNAEKLGMGANVVNFKITGASEIRSLSISLIRMKERINRQINQRTLMLSGVSHDLRTLLTRMKLQIALMTKNQEIANLESDITDMETIIDEYLEFCKGGQSEISGEVKAKIYFGDIVKSYQLLHKNITYNDKIAPEVKMICKSNNLKRAIRNIIDNAIKYTKDHIYIFTKKTKNNIIITVSDDGPGVEDKNLDKIFKPFCRLDSSRNLDIIGTGLGLSITKDIINSHGGQILASRSSYGGLCIKIILPIHLLT